MKKRSTEDISRIFSKLMMLGKVSAALKFLNESSQNGVPPPTEEVVNLLKEKHPLQAQTNLNLFLMVL